MRRVRRTRSSSERSWVTSTSVPSNVSSAASSCSIAGRSRWFVGSSRTNRLAPFCISRASVARVRSPGDSVEDGRVTWSATRPNLASSVRTSPASAPVASWNARSSEAGPSSRPRACSTSPTTTLGPIVRRPATSSARPSRTSISVDFPDPLAPTRAIRSPALTSRSMGPSWKVPCRAIAPSSRATTSPLRPGDCTCNRSCHGWRGLSTASSRSIARSVRAARPASCSV